MKLILLLKIFAFAVTDVQTANQQDELNDLNDLDWKCSEMDEALINFKLLANYNSKWFNANKTSFIILFQNQECINCNLEHLTNLYLKTNYTNKVKIDSYYAYKFKVITNLNEIICDEFIYNQFSECGIYNFEISYTSSKYANIMYQNKCKLQLANKLPINSNNFLYIAFILVILLIILFNLVKFFIEKYILKVNDTITIVTTTIVPPVSVTNNQNINTELIELKNHDCSTQFSNQLNSKKLNDRIKSLDTFRGICLFLMIFVNYGSGGYKFLQHTIWHGITIADFLYPWFLFIMGFSTMLSINSFFKKQPDLAKFKCLKKALIRFVKLFAVGIMYSNMSLIYLHKLRIMGVLQRIAICYLFVAILEIIFYRKIALNNYLNGDSKFKKHLVDLIWSWTHWLNIIFIVILWLLLTYLIPVPGCRRGYQGAGGLHDFSNHENCTGGAAGWIDRVLLGSNHLYQNPTCKKIYQTSVEFDPEGILGTFNSIFMTYFGVQAARIMIIYKTPSHRLLRWFIWSLLNFILFAAFTQFKLDNSIMPVNTNLFTLTFVFINASTAFLLLAILYIIIDVKKLWDGLPLSYLGINSITIYISHGLFQTIFPVQWLVSNTHASKLFMHLWGSVFWTIVSIVLYNKKIFIRL